MTAINTNDFTKVTYFRLVYRNGSHGAWNSDLEFVKKNANFFRADIESKEFLKPKA